MIKLDDSEIERAFAVLKRVPNGVPKAVRSSLNKTISGVRTDAKREATASYEVKSSAVHKSITIQKASGSALEAIALSRGRPIPLSSFKVKPKKVQRKGPKGRKISVSVKKGTSTTLDNAFVAQFRSGNTAVVERKTKRRLPIRKLYGPSIPKMIENDKVMDTIKAKAKDRLSKNFAHEVDRIMKGFGK